MIKWIRCISLTLNILFHNLFKWRNPWWKYCWFFVIGMNICKQLRFWSYTKIIVIIIYLGSWNSFIFYICIIFHNTNSHLTFSQLVFYVPSESLFVSWKAWWSKSMTNLLFKKHVRSMYWLLSLPFKWLPGRILQKWLMSRFLHFWCKNLARCNFAIIII
jgi:hypothetical protein